MQKEAKKNVKPSEKDALSQHNPKNVKTYYSKISDLVKGKLWLKVLIAMFFGILVGILVGPSAGIVDSATSTIIGDWLSLPGIIFLAVIQMIVIPLIFASIIIGIASVESFEQLKRVGSRVSIYFIITTTIAVILGILLATAIQPGSFVSEDRLTGIGEANFVLSSDMGNTSLGNIPSIIGSAIPTNVIGSLANSQMLEVVLFAIIFGIALVTLSARKSKPLLSLLSSIQSVSMTIVKWAMWLAPTAVFGLMAKTVSQFGVSTLFGVGIYIFTVILGLVIMMGLYAVVVFFTTGNGPGWFFGNIKEAQLLAFSTSSSAAVMPLSMKIAEEKLKVKSSISQFIIPIGATINMDGTALYQTVATLFLAQIFGINLGLGALILLLITIVGASIGTPSTPGVGIAILAVILTGIGIPVAGIALILGVDRIIDMCRTTTNVTGDLTASIFMNKIAT